MNAVTMGKLLIPVGAVGLGGSLGAMGHAFAEEGLTPGQSIVTASVSTLAGAMGAAMGHTYYGSTSGMISGALTGAGLIASLLVVPNLIPDGPFEVPHRGS